MRSGMRIAGCVLALLACGSEAPFHGTVMPDPAPAPALRLVEHGGRVFDLAAERGRVVLLFFGYTHCPDICPTTLADWRRVKAGLGADTARVRFVFVSTDPARDTPEAARRYARGFDPSFTGLTGDSATLASLERAWMIASYREPAHDSTGAPRSDPHADHASYGISHSPRTFVVDTEGRWRLMLGGGTSAEMVLGDVRKLLAE
jgi:protein SCO1/2